MKKKTDIKNIKGSPLENFLVTTVGLKKITCNSIIETILLCDKNAVYGTYVMQVRIRVKTKCDIFNNHLH